MSQNAEQLFKSIENSIEKLEEIELSYTKNKKQVTDDIASSVHQLAIISDSQAIRAKIIRELYWVKQVPTTLIAEAFGLTTFKVGKIAGSWAVEIPCVFNCGGFLTKTFQTKSELANHERESRKKRYFNSLQCKDCKEREKIKRENQEIQTNKAIRQRKQELREMAWNDYIETKEWIGTRNMLIHIAGYRCEVCHINHVTLYVYFHINTEQDHEYHYTIPHQYYVLCSNCVERCAGLINPEKGEVIRRELFEYIMDWIQKDMSQPRTQYL